MLDIITCSIRTYNLQYKDSTRQEQYHVLNVEAELQKLEVNSVTQVIVLHF